MAIGENFEQALLKAVRGAEISQMTLRMPALDALTEEELRQKILAQDDQRLFALYEALRRGISCEALHALTQIDMWFLKKIEHIWQLEQQMQTGVDQNAIQRAQAVWFSRSGHSRR